MRKTSLSETLNREVDAGELAEFITEHFDTEISARQIRTLRENGVLRFSSPSRFNISDSVKSYIAHLGDKRLNEIKKDLGDKYFSKIELLVVSKNDRDLCDEICAAATPKEAREILKKSLLPEAWAALKIDEACKCKCGKTHSDQEGSLANGKI